MQIRFLHVHFFWRLTDKFPPFVFGSWTVLHCCAKQKFYLHHLLTPHNSTHKPELIQYSFLHLLVSAECALLTMWANWVVWWKWSWIWCQLDWQGTWDVLVWQGEKTGLCMLYNTGPDHRELLQSMWRCMVSIFCAWLSHYCKEIYRKFKNIER